MSEKIRILVVDDDASVRQVICENLEDFGYKVAGAMNGEHGVHVMEAENPPHVVITDIIMPYKGGLEMILEIRKKYPSVKIIAISGGGGNKTMDFLDLAKKIGADAVIAKPIDMDMLEKTVKKLAG